MCTRCCAQPRQQTAVHLVASRQTGTATSILRALLGAAGRDIRLKVDGVSSGEKYFIKLSRKRQNRNSNKFNMLPERVLSFPILKVTRSRGYRNTMVSSCWSQNLKLDKDKEFSAITAARCSRFASAFLA